MTLTYLLRFNTELSHCLGIINFNTVNELRCHHTRASDVLVTVSTEKGIIAVYVPNAPRGCSNRPYLRCS